MAHEQGPNALLWNDEQWREEAEAWTRRRLDELGRAVTGAIDQPHVRPWGTAFTVPTNQGTVWFKASIPFTAVRAREELLGATATVGRAAEACGTVKWYEVSRAIPEWTRELYDEAVPNKLRRLIQLCA